jgi:hypothetical protein
VQPRDDPGLSDFDPWGYEIFDQDFAETGDVVIWSRSPLAPRIGELFNVETLCILRELSVVQIHTFRGGWTATCRAEEP